MPPTLTGPTQERATTTGLNTPLECEESNRAHNLMVSMRDMEAVRKTNRLQSHREEEPYEETGDGDPAEPGTGYVNSPISSGTGEEAPRLMMERPKQFKATKTPKFHSKTNTMMN